MATGDYSSSTFECKLSRKNDTPKSIFFFLCDCDVEKNRDKSLVFYHVYSGPSLTPAQPARSRRYILRTPLEKFTKNEKLTPKSVRRKRFLSGSSWKSESVNLKRRAVVRI